MKTLVIVIIICLAVLSTPLSLKKLIDRAKDGKGNVFNPSEIKDWIDDPLKSDEEEAEERKEAREARLEAAKAKQLEAKGNNGFDDDEE